MKALLILIIIWALLAVLSWVLRKVSQELIMIIGIRTAFLCQIAAYVLWIVSPMYLVFKVQPQQMLKK